MPEFSNEDVTADSADLVICAVSSCSGCMSELSNEDFTADGANLIACAVGFRAGGMA